ncbi:hypothetical protein [Thalassospira sp.]|uniref:hypothetical protein n=1 Tax=Thalassospira sp. TaxID=1912094 RepID=UPI00311F485C
MHHEDQKALGFREPPEMLTTSCLSYMGRIMELRNFVGFYFSFVKASSKIKSIFDEAPTIPKPETDEELQVVEYNFSVHRQFVNEIMLSRAVETFDLYILNILREIFQVKPEILKSSKKLDAATLIELRTPEEIIMFLAESQLNELGYEPLHDLCRWVKERTSLDVFKSDLIFDTAQIATEIRNLIAHNDCQANTVIAKRLGRKMSELEVSETGKIIVSDEFVRKCCYTLDGVVFDFDEAVASKFDVERHDRQESSYNR